MSGGIRRVAWEKNLACTCKSRGGGTAKNIWQVVLTGYIPQVRVQVTMPPYMPHHYAK